MRRASLLLAAISLVFGLGASVMASSQQTVLEVVQNSTERKPLPDDQGWIQKTIVGSNAENGEVTVELRLSNTTIDSDSTAILDPEIFIVLDISPSMDFVSPNGLTRLEQAVPPTKTLINSIFEEIPNARVGIVTFHGRTGGFFPPVGINQSQLIQGLTTNKDALLSSMDQILANGTQGGTNIDAGLQRAERNFSANAQNKVIVLITDGVPNADVPNTNVPDPNDLSSPGMQTVMNNTRSTLQRLGGSGYSIIS
ncbi:VWA domain-containing protein, partial [Candidatus Saccharibacteria bacterium]|nr:VWA domain-containing protein [Candidatus Saccharibacteria bacterium]